MVMSEWRGRSLGQTLLAICTACALGTTPAFAAGDANEPACPNESSPGFRAYLPDCRAYEMVTPADKEGALVNPVPTPTVAADGSSLAGQSRGAFAGLVSDELPLLGESDYRFTRTGSAWVTAALNPFQANLQGLGVEDSVWSPDFAGNGADHFSLVRANGAVSDIGPVWPPALGPDHPPGTY